MTPDFPDEALHFRGKTLTPESPRPVHVAEPANIPVLQNQMDPVFNDTSTYQKAEFLSENTSQEQQSGQYTSSGEVRAPPSSVQDGDKRWPSQHQSHIQGSLRSSPLLVNPVLMDTDHIASLSTATAVQTNPPLNSSPSANSARLPRIGEATADSSLTACCPPDPSSLTAHSLSGAPASFSHAPRDVPFANEVEYAVANLQTQPAMRARLDTDDRSDNNGAGNGVDFQNLLDNLPSSTAPPGPSLPGNAIPSDDATTSPQTVPGEALQSSLGLPPRPPPQEKPSIHPNYNPSDDIRSYHQLPAQTSSTSSNPYASQQSNYQSTHGPPSLAAAAPGTSLGASSLPPPPLASFQQPSPATLDSQDPLSPATQKNGFAGRQPTRSDEDTPWGPDVQKKYDEFLRDERVYVTEGLWDRFPYGSRLFVGNLPTERVTKRDLFHIFHNYGKLAQISIKQAYGFIQFLEAASCKRALEGEQGAVVRGRKVHLEISKPQRNTRPAPPASEGSRAVPARRSRSPDHSRGGLPSNRSARAPGERFDRPHEPGRAPFSDFRDEPTHRRRDDYRPSPRSPSPRSYRQREGYRSRDRTPDRFDRRERRRSRSPYGRDRRYRSPSPRGRSAYDGDADLPIPRRAARDIPDVQILVLEELDRNFIYHVEGSFRNRGLRVDVLVLGPRIPLDGAVKRQIAEGVLAVVRLSRPSQFSRKIPLQVFDRSAGKDNVRSNEYPDLEPSIAAEIVFQAQSLQRNRPSVPFAPSAYGAAPIPSIPLSHAAPSALPNQPNLANAISTLDAPALQSLLAALQQPRPTAAPTAQPPFPPTTNPQPTPDLATLLSAATRQHITPNPPQQSLPQQPFPLHAQNAAAISDPNLLSLLAKGLGGHQPQGQTALPPNVQNIMSQLGKWKP
ncbi:putative RNA-binding protein (Nab3) [Aspergillus lucknowensis]|uniref:RRM domain-containing protein n=1 Tax=Aspergillus lucknowensis TaxID=176173 RepID=A0ABR4LYB0_9EURO